MTNNLPETAGNAPEPRIYAASRASLPARPAMWKQLRSEGFNIISSWIDEAEPGATADLGELWERIYREIASADGLVLYAEADDFPLKGALIEAGIALGMGKPVHVVSPDLEFSAPSYRPIGSWITHPNVVRFKNVRQACKAKFLRVAAPSQEAAPPNQVLVDQFYKTTEYLRGYHNGADTCENDSVCEGCAIVRASEDVIENYTAAMSAEPAPSPATTNESTEREEFEEWAAESYGGDISRFLVREDEPLSDEYRAADVQSAWEAWKYRAAREPKPVAPSPATKDTPQKGRE